METLILFGGSFDPIHNGHIKLANLISQKYNANVILIPAKRPRWKSPKANDEHRLNMVKIAIKNHCSSSVSFSDYEINKNDDINYSIDTIKYFKNKYKNIQLIYLIGADQVNAFDRWKDPEEISKLCKIVYIERPGYKVNDQNVKKYKMENFKIDQLLNISSSDIRHLRTIETPFEVLDYIIKNNLYFVDEIKKYYSEKRYNHVLSVAYLSYQVSILNKLDIANKAFIAGLIHDIGKNISNEETLKIMKENYPTYIDGYSEKIYHQFVGEYIAKNELKILDGDILDSIKYHATGKGNMSPLSKIIYACDKVDPTRGYDSKKEIKALNDNYYDGFIKILKNQVEYFNKKNILFNNPLTKECIKKYLQMEI